MIPFRRWMIVGGLALLVILNSLWLSSGWLGLLFTGLLLIVAGLKLGSRLFPTYPLVEAGLYGGLLIAAAISLMSGLLYRLIGLPWWLALLVGLSVPMAATIYGAAAEQMIRVTMSIPRRRDLVIVSTAGLATIFLLIIIWQSRTGEALRSPWHVVDTNFFVWLFIYHLFLAAIFLKGATSRSAATLLLMMAMTVEMSVGLIVYAQGYGFDSFIHQATERLIFATGSVTPKPWYYLGQYGFVVTLAHLTTISIAFLDRLLLPILLGLSVPVLQRIMTKAESAPALSVFFLLALPMTMFIQTTPQGIANLIFVIITFLTFFRRPWTTQTFLLSSLLAATALIIHPLAGLPAVALIILVFLIEKYRKIWPAVVAGAAILPMLPLLFWQLESKASASPAMPGNIQAAIETTPDDFWYAVNRFEPIMDTVAHITFNIPLLVTLAAVAGLIILIRREHLTTAVPHLVLATVLLIDAVLLSKYFSFSYLIDYEREAFVWRLCSLAGLVILPLTLTGVSQLWSSLTRRTSLAIFALAIFLAAFKTIGVYASYPRYDGYAFDRGYSTSAHDFAAVRSIEQTARGQYVVLANQAVSAAALTTFGFGRTISSGQEPSLYFYPIPTSGQLYQKYLAMVADPSDETIRAAMDLAGVNEAYFVLNDYWFDAENISKKAQATSDAWWPVDAGKLMVFVYRR